MAAAKLGSAVPFKLGILMLLCLPGFHSAAIEVERAGVVQSTRSAGFQDLAGTSEILSNGDAIIRNASIQTDIRGTVAIRMDDGSQVHVSENSRVTVDDFLFDPQTQDGRSVLSLTKGTLRMISGHLPSHRYQLRTPVATIGVRGTDYTVALAGQNGLVLKVDDGEVTLRPSASDIEYAFRAPSVVSCTPTGCDRIDPNDSGRGRGRAGGRGGRGAAAGPGAGPGGPGAGPGGPGGGPGGGGPGGGGPGGGGGGGRG